MLAACVHTQSYTEPLVVSVKRDREQCRVTVNGERMTSETLLELGRRAPNRRGIVLYNKETPYQCTGAAIVTLQRAGLAYVESAMCDDS